MDAGLTVDVYVKREDTHALWPDPGHSHIQPAKSP